MASEDFDNLTKTSAVSLKNYLDSINTPGVEELKMDVDLNNPEITFTVDRQRASDCRGKQCHYWPAGYALPLFGREASKIKEGEDEYKIQIRNNEMQRNNLTDLLNMEVIFRDFAAGGRMIKRVPISTLVKVDLTSTRGQRKT